MTATRSPFSISSDVLSNSMRSWYPWVSFSMLSACCLMADKVQQKSAHTVTFRQYLQFPCSKTLTVGKTLM